MFSSTIFYFPLPFTVHPKYSEWHPSEAWDTAGPRQYPYSDSETMNTDEDTAEFLEYRVYRYFRSCESSEALLKEMGKAEVTGEPWPRNSCVIGGEVRQVSRQQEGLEEVRGLRPFSAGYPRGSQPRVADTPQVMITAQSANSPASKQNAQRPTPRKGSQLGLGGTARSGPPRSRPREPTRTSAPTIRTTRSQDLRAESVRVATVGAGTRSQTPNTRRPSSREETGK